MALARNALSKPRGSAYNALQTATGQKIEPYSSLEESLCPRMAKLDIHLLGEFSLTYNNAPLTTVNTQRLQELLAYLVLNRHAPQTRQRIAFLLWPDSDESQARANLRNLWHHLEKALPDPQLLIHSDGQTLQWNIDASYRLDLQEFEQAAQDHTHIASLERAVHLYRGDLLPGFYSDWILRERERLDTVYTDTLARLVRELAGNGTNQSALEYARRLVQHDPLREDAYRDLMMLHARRGDRAGVQRVYRECVAILKRELDVEPGAETRRAYEQALRYEPPPTKPPLSSPAVLIEPARPEPVPPKLVKRDLTLSRQQKELLMQGIVLAVPLMALVGLLLLQVPWYFALPIAILLFGGLGLMLVYRPGVELEKQKLMDETQLKLDASRGKVAHLQALARNVTKPEVQERIVRICTRADVVLTKLDAEERIKLSTASKFEYILAETLQILNQYQRMCNGQIAAHPDNLAATTERIENQLLPSLEQAMDEFAVALDRGDMAALEAAIRVLESTLKHEGMD